MASSLTSPLYVTGQTPEGRFLLGGIFQMQDRVGFPLDASFEECQSRGFEIDWLEALCDCWLNDCKKYDSFVRHAELLTEADLDNAFKTTGSNVLRMFPEMKLDKNPVNSFCRYILDQKRKPTQT